MTLPFSHDAFLDVFGSYNSLLWPAVLAIWVVTALVAITWLRTGVLGPRLGFGLLAVHWGWSAVAYHWMHFRRINPAASVFATLFLLQAAAFAWLLVTRRGAILVRSNLRGVVSAGFVLYGLAYPFIGLSIGLQYPRLPLFAVPCPTALVTAGLLVAATDVPRLVLAVPCLWALVGSSAAFALGIRADLALLVAAGVLALDVIAPDALGARTSRAVTGPGR